MKTANAQLDRRSFLTSCVAALGTPPSHGDQSNDGAFLTCGVVLLPEDLSLTDWPDRAKRAGLTTIGIHHQNSPQAVIDWIKKDAGQRILEQCQKLGLQVEYELHAMKELLPRSLFAKNPAFFRMDEKGERRPDANCCVHSDGALKIITENALRIADALRPTTGRCFFWGDDGMPWCACPKCRDFSPADQALIVENRLCSALRERDPHATVAHLAYANTLPPPQKTKPREGVFLEYAPINRRYDAPYEKQQDPKQPDGISMLDANLAVFPRDSARVLEYWLDVSRFSHRKRPAVQLPWNEGVFQDDVAAYRRRGIRHVTTFAAWIDEDYRQRFGNLAFIEEYGKGLQ